MAWVIHFTDFFSSTMKDGLRSAPPMSVIVFCHVSHPGAVAIKTCSPGVAISLNACIPLPGGNGLPLDTSFPSRWISKTASPSDWTTQPKGILVNSDCLHVTHDVNDKHKTTIA
ncbi:MAG: hypothetical protein KKD14_04965 [Verrucomicrobia bacterium]|nr:hypothetical protein [Verrucomicrobiota bacterium]